MLYVWIITLNHELLNMRTEMKIALVLFAANMVVGHLLQAPEFLRGLPLGLSLFFMVVALLPEGAYTSYREFKTQKFGYLKKLITRN